MRPSLKMESQRLSIREWIAVVGVSAAAVSAVVWPIIFVLILVLIFVA